MRLNCSRLTGFILALALGFVGAVPASAQTITSFTPASGNIGTKVTITGSGFTGATAVKFHGATSVYTVNSATTITATVPATASTGPISVATGAGTATSSTNFTVTPGISLPVNTGPPTTVVNIWGAGFDAYSAVDLYFDTADQALASASSTGNFGPIAVQIPASAPSGTHWLTAVERGSKPNSAQVSFLVMTNWAMDGFGASGRRYNPYENTIGPWNVNSLVRAWSGPSGGFANPSPFVAFGGNIYVGDANGAIHAYSSTGSLLWTAAPGTDLESVTPAAYAGRVFFGGSNGNVYAYGSTCRSDGGVCSPVWTTNVGTAVTASLTVYKGLVYAPANDGFIYPLNPTTGAKGTGIFGLDTSHGAVTTPVVFDPDGSFFYANGNFVQFRTSGGVLGWMNFGATVSPIAVYNGAAYFTTSDGVVHQLLQSGWSAVTSGTGCYPAPAVANNLVYAGGCSNIQAFEAGTGALQWSVSSGPVLALSVANGVLYACASYGGGFGGIVVAYDASYGGLLWTGGQCGGEAVIANGNVYSAFAEVSTYNMGAAGTTVVKPDPQSLVPDPKLHPARGRRHRRRPPLAVPLQEERE